MQSNSQSVSLLRAIGILGLASTIFNCTVGGGIFSLPGVVFGISGAWTPLVHIVCGLVILSVGLCFVRVGGEAEKSGGPYAYVEKVFGPYAGMLTGVLTWLLGTLSMGSVAAAYSISVGKLVPGLDGNVARFIVLAITMGLVGWINIRGVRQGTKLILSVTIAKLVPLLILLVVGLIYMMGDSVAANPIVSTPFDAGSFTRACMLMIFAYTGIESALVPSGEIINPRKTLPRAIMLGLVGVVFLYLILQLISQAVLGADLALANETPLADVALHLMGNGGRVLLLVGAMVSMFGFLCAMTLANPRCLYAFGQDGLLPRSLAWVHPEHQTPWPAILVQVVAVLILASNSTFDKLAIISNLACTLAYLFCVGAAWKLNWDSSTSPASRLRGSIIPVLSLLMMCWLLTSITLPEWIWCIVTMALASIGYAYKKSKTKAG